MSLDRIVLEPQAARSTSREELVDHARRRGFRRFLGEPVPGRTGEDWYRPDAGGWRSVGSPNGLRIEERTVVGPAELEGARAGLREGRTLLLRWQGERVLPLETLVAEGLPPERLWVRASAPRELPAMLGALEHGAGVVVCEVRSPAEIDEIEDLAERAPPGTLDWRTVEVSRIEPAGPGDRVIVDTTSLLAPDEGLLVGSVAGFLFHVGSEAVGSQYTRPRPFRVNAGGPHSYVLLADGTSRYLAELVPGDRVLVARPQDGTRAARVGRIKIERRPLSLVVSEDDGRPVTVFLQEAETVRLAGAEGPIEVTRLRAGDRVQGVRVPRARHLGTVVHEQIEER